MNNGNAYSPPLSLSLHSLIPPLSLSRPTHSSLSLSTYSLTTFFLSPHLLTPLSLLFHLLTPLSRPTHSLSPHSLSLSPHSLTSLSPSHLPVPLSHPRWEKEDERAREDSWVKKRVKWWRKRKKSVVSERVLLLLFQSTLPNTHSPRDLLPTHCLSEK